MAQQLTAGGLAVYAVDPRGRGQSDGERFYVDKLADWVSDVGSWRRLNHANPVCLCFFWGTVRAASSLASTHSSISLNSLDSSVRALRFGCRRPTSPWQLSRGFSHVAPHAHVYHLKNEDFSRDPGAVPCC